MKVTISKIYYFVLATLFMQMLFLPKLYMWVKAICILVAIIFCIYICKDHIKITNGKFLMLINLALNVTSTAIGIWKGYGAYAIRTGTINIIWPVCFLLMMDIHLKNKQLTWLYIAIIRITFILCIWDIAFLFERKWIIDWTLLLNRDIPRSQAFSNWFLRVDHLYFYAFLVPFIMGVLFNGNKEFLKKLNVSKGFVYITFFLSIFIVVLSNMGGIWLACSLGVIICFFKFRLFSRKRILVLTCISAVLIAGFLINSYSRESIAYMIVNEVLSKFSNNGSGSQLNSSVRFNEAKAMISSWIDAPVLGQGTGYPVSYYRFGEYVTQAENELQYLVILYQRGMLGILSFFSIVAYAVYILERRKDIGWLCEPFMVGMICFLIANAFNPYLSNLSMMWILYFPFWLENKN